MASGSHRLTAVLELQDRFSSRLNNALRAVNQLQRNTQNAQRTVQRMNTTMAGGVGAANRMSSGMNSASNSMGRFASSSARAHSQFSNFTSRSTVSIGRLVGRLGALALAIGGVVGIGRLASTAIGGAARLEQDMISMEHFIGLKAKPGQDPKKMTSEFVAYLRKNANETPFSTNEIMSAGRRSVTVANGNLPQAKQLLTLAENMAALNPGKTVMDAMEALADMRTGETERMKEFGFKITQNDLKKAGRGNATSGAMKLMTDPNLPIVQTFKGGADKLANSAAGKWSTITGNIESALTDIGTKILDKAKPLMDRIIAWMDSPAFAKFSTRIANGVGLVAGKIADFLMKITDGSPESEAKLQKLWATLEGIGIVVTKVAGWIGALGQFMANTSNDTSLLGKALRWIIGALVGVRLVAGPAGLVGVLKAIGTGLFKTTVFLFSWGRALRWIAGMGFRLALSTPFLRLGTAIWGTAHKLLSFGQWVKALPRNAVVGFANALAKIGPFLTRMGPLLMNLLRFLNPMRLVMLAVTAAQWLWNAAMAANPITWIIVAIVALGVGIYMLIKHWDAVRGAVLKFWGIIKKNPILAFITGPIGLLVTAVGLITDNWGTLSTFFTNLWGGIKDVFSTTINWIIDKLNWLIDKANEIKIDVPEWLGGGTIGVNMKHIDNIGRASSGPSTGGSHSAMPNSHSAGLSSVPYDGYLARLHRGERVMTAYENRQGSQPSVIIPKLADTIIVREEADIDKISRGVAQHIMRASGVMA
jgi:hypothetical protein